MHLVMRTSGRNALAQTAHTIKVSNVNNLHNTESKLFKSKMKAVH